MPTYTNPKTTNYLEAGINIAGGETKTVALTLTEMVVTLPAAVPGLGLELVTEATSGETGRIYWIDGADIGLVELSGAFTGELELTADTTGSLGTPAAGALDVVLTRDTATNFYSALLNRQTIEASGAETIDVYLNRAGTWIVLYASHVSPFTNVNIAVKNGASGDLIIALQSGQLWQDMNRQRYQHLQLEFEDAGQCEVFEFDCDFNPLSFSTL